MMRRVKIERPSSIRRLIELRNSGHGYTIAIPVQTVKDVALFKKLVNGFEAKTVSIYSKEDYIRSYTLNLLPICSPLHRPKLLLEYLRGKIERFHQVFHTYNKDGNIIAFIYKPWNVVITDGYSDSIYEGSIERIYEKLKVNINLTRKEIEIII